MTHDQPTAKKKILFVDDEPRILDGLRRMLRSHRKSWDMVFVDSGPRALEALGCESFDVLVTDMRMPGMDGAELLKSVQERSPQTARIVLSGHSDMKASLRSVHVSHQFLAKPCEARELTAVVEQACGLHALLEEPALRSQIAVLSELPGLPRVYEELVCAMADEEVDLRDVGAIVEQDVGISAKLLQIVNSSYFGIRREIVNVTEAATYLGLTVLRDLVLSIEVFGQRGAGSLKGLSLEREQRHSLSTGHLARMLAEDSTVAEQAFLAGMLHDVGKLIIGTQLPDAMKRIVAERAETGAPVHEIEQRVIGVTHAEIGGYLLGLWGMPYSIVEAVAFHHRPSRAAVRDEFGVLAATHVADALAHESWSGVPPSESGLDVGYLEELGVIGRIPEWRERAWEFATANEQAA